jgi:Tfp pilus assembly protein PilF
VTDTPKILYCPSCAAKLPDDILSSTEPECPVCGTKLTGADAPVAKEAEKVDQPARRLSTEEILLDRLKADAAQPPARKLPVTFFAILIAVIAIAAYSIYSATKKPEQFAKPKNEDGLTLEQRAMIQHATDSLSQILGHDPNNTEAHIALANVYYDGKDWKSAAPHYEAYLARHPDDPSARVDYSFVLSQTQPQNLNIALAQIDTALKFKPDFLSALYNGGILAVQMTGSSHAEGLARARAYFERAKAVADTAAPEMAKQIDTLITEIDRTGARIASEKK